MKTYGELKRERRLRAFHNELKRSSFGEFKKYEERRERVSLVIAIIVIILFLLAYVGITFAVGLYFDEKSDDEAMNKVGKYICNQANQEYVNFYIFESGMVVAECNKERIIIHKGSK